MNPHSPSYMPPAPPPSGGGGGLKIPILFGSVLALLGANVYLFMQLDKTKSDVKALQASLKTELQEVLQARRRPLPRYELLELAPASGAGTCRVRCHVPGLPDPVEGSGRNRRLAEQQAARRALEDLRSSGEKT